MPRANAMVPPDAIRIEDEVWQEAFARREPGSPNRRRRLEAIDGGRTPRRTDQAATHAGRIPASRAAEGAPRTATNARASAAPVPAETRPRPVGTTLSSTSTVPAPGRRTIKIQGRGAERNLPVPDRSRRRPALRPHERAGFRPDRVAMWAVVLGFVLIVVAAASGHG